MLKSIFTYVLVIIVTGLSITISAGGETFNQLKNGTTIIVPEDYSTIQSAIDASSDGDTIIIEDGIYTGTGNRGIDFNGKEIIVRSRNGPDNCIIDCQQIDRGFLFHNFETHLSKLVGITITNGSAYLGGGIKCSKSNPMIQGCVIENSASFYQPFITLSSGGGIYISECSPIIKRCIISNNFGNKGGGIQVYRGSPTIVKSSILNNFAYAQFTQPTEGGGMNLYESDVTISNCNFSYNLADGFHGHGGGIYNYGGDLTINKCIFFNNQATEEGGAISGSNIKIIKSKIICNTAENGGGISGNADVFNSILSGNHGDGAAFRGRGSIINSMIVENSGENGAIKVDCNNMEINGSTIANNSAGGIFVFSYVWSGNVHANVINNILWDNGINDIALFGMEGYEITYGSTMNMSWSDYCTYSVDSFSTLNEGNCNINKDPLFVDAENKDYHLKRKSPCINAGDPNFIPNQGETDIDGNPRVVRRRIDMGADEFILKPFPLQISSEYISQI